MLLARKLGFYLIGVSETYVNSALLRGSKLLSVCIIIIFLDLYVMCHILRFLD